MANDSSNSNSDKVASDAALGSGIGGGIGDLIGWFLSQGDRDTARQLLAQANPNISAPQIESMLGSMDPTGRNDQLAALAQLKQIYQSGGLDPIARAQIAQAQARADQNARALEGNIQNQMDQRALGSSGLNYGKQLEVAGMGADRANAGDLQAGAGAEARGLSALNDYLGGSGMLRGQDIQTAEGQDAIARFNAQNSMLGQQQSFNNDLTKSGGYQGFANQTVQVANGVGSGLGAGLGAAWGSQGGSQNKNPDFLTTAAEVAPMMMG